MVEDPTFARTVFIAVLILYGVIHAYYWILRHILDPPRAKSDDPVDSWLFGHQPGLARALALVAAGSLVAGGIGLWVFAGWWRPVAVVGLALSTGLTILYYNPDSSAAWFHPAFTLSVNIGLIVLFWLDLPLWSVLENP